MPTASSKRPWLHTSSPVMLYLPTILRESRVPTVIAKLRSLAFSKPGTACRSPFRACTTLARPSISAEVRLLTSRESTPDMCTRFKLVASPAFESADQEPPNEPSLSAGMTPAFTASSNSVSRYGDRNSSSLPVVVCSQVRLQSLYVAGFLLVYSKNFSVLTFAALNTVVTPKDCWRSMTEYWQPARCATSASPVQSMTRSARMAWRPDFDSVTTPKMLFSLSKRTSTTQMCRIGLTPASVISLSATSLNCSPSRQFESLYGHFVVPPMRSAMRSISRPMPSQSSVPSYLYQPRVSMPTVVMVPPKQP
mmetsp:Transcript_82490/g.237190  ORF Transcript_82490/g.237190 Transcript_82490/m.237190 type:complete len:308 (+) Transcript_82490:520-1443(+)